MGETNKESSPNFASNILSESKRIKTSVPPKIIKKACGFLMISERIEVN